MKKQKAYFIDLKKTEMETPEKSPFTFKHFFEIAISVIYFIYLIIAYNK